MKTQERGNYMENFNPFTGEIDTTAPSVREAAQVSTSYTLDEDEKIVANLTSRQVSYCSFVPKTEDEKLKLFNAMNSPTDRVSDHINEEILIHDVYIEAVQCENKMTGELTWQPRVILIGKDKSYQCVSTGIYGSIKKAIQAFGAPTWEKGIKFKVQQIRKSAEKNILTVSAVGFGK
jgi:hypothetical protein